MLKTLRKKNVAKKIFIVLAIIIIPAFMLWGSGSLIRGKGKTTYAGVLFGSTISLDEYRENFLATRNEALMRFGDNFFKVQNVLDLHQETWDRMIALHEAQAQRIKIADAQVVEKIQSNPLFQKNDQFDPKLYDHILNYYFKVPAREFEEQTRDSLKIEALYLSISDGITIDDEELWEAYKKDNEKIKLSYIQFAAKDFEAEISLGDDEIESYYTDHNTDFTEPPAVNIEYIGFEYPEETSSEDIEKINTQCIELAKAAIKELDFSVLSQQFEATHKESDFFSSQGPVIGFGWNMELIQLSFSLKENQISQPLQTEKGCYILRLKEKRDAYIPPLQEVRGAVEKILIREKTQKLATTQAQHYFEQFQQQVAQNPESFDFAQAAAEVPREVQMTPLFQYEDYIPNIGSSKQFFDAGFALTENKKVIALVSALTGHYIIRLDDYQEANKEKFTQEQESLQELYLKRKKSKTFNDFFMQLREKAQLQDNIPRETPSQPAS
ncbi:SurA N-terminal domain-containing protein [Candidatus Omnitrophota bacterium]